jgi:hypothetical protein
VGVAFPEDVAVADVQDAPGEEALLDDPGAGVEGCFVDVIVPEVVGMDGEG